MKSIISATKGVPKHIMDEIRKALKQINIKAFYEKWKVLQLNDDESLTITEETHGLATNVFLTCKKKTKCCEAITTGCHAATKKCYMLL